MIYPAIILCVTDSVLAVVATMFAVGAMIVGDRQAATAGWLVASSFYSFAAIFYYLISQMKKSEKP